MKKLWQKNKSLHPFIEGFTVGKDMVFDQQMAGFDCLASIVHAKALQEASLLSPQEFLEIKSALLEVIELNKKNKFVLVQGDEDVHSKIENFLTKKLGATGKKIHAGRSRNDQSLAMIRLYAKKELIETEKLLLQCASALLKFAQEHEFTPLPGYSHMKQAMPSSIGLWAGAFAESFLDDLNALGFAFGLIDQNPLGSGAGFGSPFNLDREHCTGLLGFKKLQKNTLYVQNSRGKFESAVIYSLVFTALDLNKVATDLLLYSTDEFGFFSFSESITTGSSAMPHKQNPDVLELIRAKSNVLTSNLFQVLSIISSLPSGYNRDFQLTKAALVESFELMEAILKAFAIVLKNIEVHEKKILASFNEQILSADHANELAKKGLPFRDAFMKTKTGFKPKGQGITANLKSKKSAGMPGNLGLKQLKKLLEAKKAGIEKKEKSFNCSLKQIQKL